MRQFRGTCSLVTVLALGAFTACASGDATGSQTQALAGPTCSPDAPITGRRTIQDATATGLWDPFGFLTGSPVGSFDISNATVTCPGGTPTGDVTTFCSADSNGIQVRGMLITARMNSSDSRVNGWLHLVVNFNWDMTQSGPQWGTFHVDLDAGGSWDGNWTGTRSAVADGCGGNACWTESVRFVGCGTGGAVDGLHYRGTENLLSYSGASTSQYSIEIIAP